MSRPMLLSLLTLVGVCSAATAQLPRVGGMRAGFGQPPTYAPFSGPSLRLDATATNFYPGSGPTSAATPFFASSLDRRWFGLYGGLYAPYYYPYTDRMYVDYYRPIVPVPAVVSPPPEENITSTVLVSRQRPAAPLEGFPAQPESTTKARLILNVPENAEVYVGGEKTNLTGARRVFESPDLTPGQQQNYDIRVVWKENGKTVDESRTLALAAGESKSLTYVAAPSQVAQQK
jgi:uncharacterized protein (TIGR03000 family)